jgi:hypothetical protein
LTMENTYHFGDSIHKLKVPVSYTF